MCPNQQPQPRPRILVDADSCPVVDDIASLAHNWGIRVFLISNICHDFSSLHDVSIIRVDNTPEAADFALVNHSQPGDIVVTQDIGVACMVLGKKAKPLSPRGHIYREQDIVSLMEMRHIMQKAKRRGQLRGGLKRFSDTDRKRFLKNLKLLVSLCQKEGADGSRD